MNLIQTTLIYIYNLIKQYKSSATLITVVYGGALITYIFQVAMAILLEPKHLTLVLTFNSLTQIVSVLSNSLQTSAAKITSELQGNNSDTYQLMKNGTKSVSLYSGLFSILLGCVSLIWLPVKLAMFMNFSISSFLSTLIGFNRGILQGMQKTWALGMSMTTWSALRFCVGIAMIWIGFQSTGVIYAFNIAFLMTLLLNFWFLGKLLDPNTSDISHTESHLISKVWNIPVFICMILLSILLNMDILLAKQFMNLNQAAMFSVISILSKAAYFGSTAVALALFPRAIQSMKEGEKPIQIVVISVLLAMLITTIFVIIYAVFANYSISIFTTGKYPEIGNYIHIYTIGMGALGLTFTLSHLLIALGTKHFYWLYLISTITCITLIALSEHTISILVNYISIVCIITAVLVLSLTIISLKRLKLNDNNIRELQNPI